MTTLPQSHLLTNNTWLLLAALNCVSPGRWLELIKQKGVNWIANSLAENPDKLLSSLGKAYCHKHVQKKITDAEQWCHAKSCNSIISYDEPSYPEQLRLLTHPPLVLFTVGDHSLLKMPQLAIVGSRRATINGKEQAFSFARELADHNIVITSGLAQGIDAAAHRGAIASGKTIAVMGHGLNRIYPARHMTLADSIVESGSVIISEFFPNTPPRPHQFPQRNRIIAALSLGTLVVEATIRSGTLITANLAADLGKEVFAIPGSILAETSEGCHALIKDGAILVSRVEDVLNEYPELLSQSADIKEQVEKSESNRLASCKILASVEFEVTPCDVIAQRSDLPVHEVMALLLEYELRGLVATVPGGYVKLRGK